jgi:hypothetical protein
MAAELTAKGIQTPRDGQWSACAVRNVLLRLGSAAANAIAGAQADLHFVAPPHVSTGSRRWPRPPPQAISGWHRCPHPPNFFAALPRFRSAQARNAGPAGLHQARDMGFSGCRRLMLYGRMSEQHVATAGEWLRHFLHRSRRRDTPGLLRAGRSERFIARQLGISKGTVGRIRAELAAD